MCWTLLQVGDAQKASQAREAMALQKKDPFQRAAVVEARLSLTGVFEVFNAARELRDSTLPTTAVQLRRSEFHPPKCRRCTMRVMYMQCLYTTCPLVTKTFYIAAREIG